MRLVSMALGALVLTCLAGCSGGVATDVYRGLPEGVEVDPATEEPVVTRLGAESFAVLTWGSSSCAPTATSLTVVARDEVVVDLTPSTRTTCSADMGPTTHEIDVPEEASGDPLSVTLSFEGVPDSVHVLD